MPIRRRSSLSFKQVNMQPILLILAAGVGSRYGGLKQVDGMGPGGEAILEYSVYDAIRAGFGKVVFVIRKDIEAAFREKVGARIEKRIPSRLE
jgi:CTP:molybdopterin cytidylyltransferase MocA